MKSRYWIKQLSGTLFFFLVMFIGAGRVDYWQGLVYAATGLIMFVLNHTTLRIDPTLLEKRARPGESTLKRDKVILGLSFLCTVSMFLIAGLDSGRYHWSPDFHWGLYITGIIMTAGGQLIFLVAQKQNRFFFSTVQSIDNEEHTVCENGLYGFIRHPAYMGAVIQLCGFPLFFGSIWSIIPVAVLIVLQIVRTGLEDRLLLKELKAYPNYASRIRYRLIPYIW